MSGPVQVSRSRRARRHTRRLPRLDRQERNLLESEARQMEVQWDAESRARVEDLRDRLTEANRLDPNGAWAKSYRERLDAATRVANRRVIRRPLFAAPAEAQ